MATVYLQDELSGGTYTEIYLGGTAPVNKVVTAIITDALETTNSNQQLEINNHETRIGTLETSAGIVPKLLFTPQGTPPTHQEGVIYYDSIKKTHTSYIDVAGVALNIGQEIWKRVYNGTGVAIQNGVALKQVGVQGGVPSVALAQADTISNAKVLGVSTHLISAGEIGVITLYGEVDEVDTSSLILGDNVWLSATIAGGMTNTPPTILTHLGTTTLSSVTGTLDVRIVSNLALPTIFGAISHGSSGTALLANTWDNLKGYVAKGNAILETYPTEGTIYVTNTGSYRATINLAIQFDAIGNSSAQFDLGLFEYVDGGAGDIEIDAMTDFIAKTGESISFYPSFIADLVADKKYIAKIRSAVALANVNYSLSEFDLTSVYIR